MKQILCFMVALLLANYLLGQASATTSVFPTTSGTTSATFVGIKSTRVDGYKLSMQGALKIWGTGNSTNGVNFSPTILFDNRTASTGRKYYLQSSNEGNFRIVDSTAGELTRIIINSSGNVGIGTTSPTALFHTVGTVRHDVGSDATGDIYYRNSSGLFTRLPIGTSGQVLTVSSGLPAWAAGGGGITSLNNLFGATQNFATGTAGTDFGISSSGAVHTFNLPTASSSARGLLSSADWSAFNSKAPATGGTGYIQNGTAVQSGANFNISGNGTIGSNLTVKGTSLELGSASQSGQVVMYLKQQSNPSGNGWNFGYTSSSSSDLYIYGHENAAFRVYTNTLERMTVDANGNVGIGNNNPSVKLHVYGTGGIPAIFRDVSSGAASIRVENGNGYYADWGVEGSNIVSFKSNGTTFLYGTAAGNVGIGTSSPATKLDVNGTLKVEGTAASQVQFTGNNQYNPGFVFNGSTSNTHTYTFDSQNFSTTTAGNTLVSGGLFSLNNYASVNPFQQPLTILRSWPGVGTANTVIIDNDNQGAVPSTYRIASFRLTGTEKAWIDQTGGAWFDGSVGIGTNNPQANLDVNGTVKLNNSLFVNSNGTVGIGNITTYPPFGDNYKLAVGGNIIAEKVRVKLQSAGWPDYVFNTGYELPSLKETEKYIQQNKHLPGVPSAATIEKEGLDLGDGQAVLLKKIEEMTLHMIEMNKKLEKLEAENEMIKNKMKKER